MDIPSELFPTEGWGIVEAYLPGEPESVVPIDRVAVRASDVDKVKLLLPAGQYRLRSVHVPPAE